MPARPASGIVSPMADAARIQRDMKGTASYLGQVKRQGALRVQAATPALLKRAMAGLSRAALTRRPAPGKWSLQEIVCHLADTEVARGWRHRMILAQSGSPLTAFDQDRWANEMAYRREDPKVALEAFTALRRRDLALIRRTPRSAWSRFGIPRGAGPRHLPRPDGVDGRPRPQPSGSGKPPPPPPHLRPSDPKALTSGYCPIPSREPGPSPIFFLWVGLP